MNEIITQHTNTYTHHLHFVLLMFLVNLICRKKQINERNQKQRAHTHIFTNLNENEEYDEERQRGAAAEIAT